MAANSVGEESLDFDQDPHHVEERIGEIAWPKLIFSKQAPLEEVDRCDSGWKCPDLSQELCLW
jgi:hypothetical protein